MYEINKIDNITVLEKYNENDTTFTLAIYFKTGSINEKENEKGISHFLEHMMFNGTEKRTSLEISELLDFYGTYYNAYTTKDHTKYHISSLSINQKEVLDVFFDMMSNPSFLEEQIKKEKEIVFEEIRMSEDEIKIQATEKMQYEIFENNLKYPILGTIDSVGKISQEMLFSYFNRNYTKDNMILAISGKYDKHLLYSQIKEYFKQTNEKNEKYVLEDKVKKVSIYKKEKMNQVNIFLIREDDNKEDSIKKLFLTGIVENILGDGFSSRLFKEIREKRSLAYEVYNFSYRYDNLDVFGIYIGSSKNKYKEAIEVTNEILREFKKDKITEKEFQKAKNSLQFSQLSNRTNQKNVSRMYIMYDRYRNIYDDKYLQDLILNITLEEVNGRIDELINEFSTFVIGDIND